MFSVTRKKKTAASDPAVTHIFQRLTSTAVLVPVKPLNTKRLPTQQGHLFNRHHSIYTAAREKECLSISVRKTSGLMKGIRSTANVKHVYPAEADGLASIHHKHNRFLLRKLCTLTL